MHLSGVYCEFELFQNKLTSKKYIYIADCVTESFLLFMSFIHQNAVDWIALTD